MPSTVQLGFVLLEGIEEGTKKYEKSDDMIGPDELGTQVLKSLFEVHDMARNEVSMKGLCSSNLGIIFQKVSFLILLVDLLISKF